MGRAPAPLIVVGGVGLAAALYLPHLLTASWVYWESITALWSDSAPTIGTRLLPGLAYTLWSSPDTLQVVNFTLHVAVACLVGGLLSALGHGRWAAAGSLLFLVNPVAVESIRHATGTADLCVGLGTLGACLAAVRRRWLLMGLGLLVALTSKESGVVSLGLVPLTLWLARVRVSQEWAVWYGLSVWMGLAVLLLWAHPVTGLVGLMNRDLYAEQVPLLSWALLQATATVRLLTSAVTGLGMTPDFDYDAVRVGWRVASAVVLVAGAVYAWTVRASSRLVAAGLAWVLLASSVRFVIKTPMAYYNEHQFYAALPGVLLLVVGVLQIAGEAADVQLDACLAAARRWWGARGARRRRDGRARSGGAAAPLSFS